jgi:hypothetical protein
MTDKGLDYSYARPSIALLHNLGIKFVCRYLSYPSGKVIGKTEYDNYIRNGIEVFLNWEFQAEDGVRGASFGRKYATEALKQAKALNYPKGATIYFSTGDFDVFGKGEFNQCLSYDRAASEVVRAAGYRYGVYGSREYLAALWVRGVIDDGWQSPSTFGREHYWRDPRNHVYQHNLDTVYNGNQVDLNDRVGVTYSSSYKPPVNHPPVPVPLPKPPELPEGDDDDMKCFIVARDGDGGPVFVGNGITSRWVQNPTDLKNLLHWMDKKLGVPYGTTKVEEFAKGTVKGVLGALVGPAPAPPYSY